MADLQPVIFPPAQPIVVTVVNDSGSIIVTVPDATPIIETPVETIVVIEVSDAPVSETLIVELSGETVIIMPPVVETVVVMETTEIVVITETQGPQGAPGPTGDAVMPGTAGEALAAYRVVRDSSGSFFYADQTVEADAATIVGLTTTSAGLSAPTNVQIIGEIYNAAWTWTIGAPVFVVGQGQLSQTAPSTGSWVLQIGTATYADRLFIRPATPIYL